MSSVKKRDSLSAAKVPFFKKVLVSSELVAFLQLPTNEATFFEVYQHLCVYLDAHKLRSESTSSSTVITLNAELQRMFDTKEISVSSVRLYESIGTHCTEHV